MFNQVFHSLSFIGPLGTPETILILVVVLVLFGGKKIPEFFRGVGRGVGELQKGIAESKASLDKNLRDDDEPVRREEPLRREKDVESSSSEEPLKK